MSTPSPARLDALHRAVDDRKPEALAELLASGEGAAAAARLEAEYGREGRRLTELLLDAFDRVTGRDRIRVTCRVLRRESFRADWRLLLGAASRAGPSGRRALQKRVFSKLHGRGARYEAILVGLTLSDDDLRRRYLEEQRAALEADDHAASSALMERHRWWARPEGFEVVRAHLGTGKTCRVALVRRRRDGREFAWKVPTDDSERTRRLLETLVERSGAWRRLGISDAEASFAPDGRTLLQPFVAGRTLHAVLREAPLLEDGSHPMTVDLERVFRRLVDARTFVSGLNPKNLVFDGRRWHVIDSGSINPMPSRLEAWCLQRRDFLHQMTRWTTGGEEAVRAFLRRQEARFDLPPLVGLRWGLLRLRRSVLGRRPGKI